MHNKNNKKKMKLSTAISLLHGFGLETLYRGQGQRRVGWGSQV